MKRVLIGEDNELLANLWCRALRVEGLDVVLARDGEEVVRMAQESHFDAILLDIMMPRMDGLEACRRISTGDDVPPVVFVTCCARSSDMEEATNLHAADFFVKGRFSMPQLVNRVLQLLAGPFQPTAVPA